MAGLYGAVLTVCDTGPQDRWWWYVSMSTCTRVAQPPPTQGPYFEEIYPRGDEISERNRKDDHGIQRWSLIKIAGHLRNFSRPSRTRNTSEGLRRVAFRKGVLDKKSPVTGTSDVIGHQFPDHQADFRKLI